MGVLPADWQSTYGEPRLDEEGKTFCACRVGAVGGCRGGGEEVGVAVVVEPLLSGAEERTTRRGWRPVFFFSAPGGSGRAAWQRR